MDFGPRHSIAEVASEPGRAIASLTRSRSVRRALRVVRDGSVPATDEAVHGDIEDRHEGIAINVEAIMPPNTTVPIDCWLAAPAPSAVTSGSTPRMKAKEVMRMGRNRRRVASIRSIAGGTCRQPLARAQTRQ